MKTFLLRRLLSIVPLLLAVTFITQGLLILSPGDYVDTLSENPAMTKERLEAMRVKYHLDTSNVFVRYGYWLKGAVTGDLGYSFQAQKDVVSLIFERVLNTLLLTIGALVISWGLAIPLGIVSAVKKDTLVDRIAGGFSFFGLSIPTIFFSLMLVLFAARTGLFPTGGVHDLIYWDYFTPWQKFKDMVWHLFLPATVLGTAGMAQYMRQMRGEMIETLSQDYIRTAKAKGLSQSNVLARHAVGNAINPLVTLFGFSFAHLLSGAFITEFVFSWPGMGRLTVDALIYKDEPVVMASIVLVTSMLVIGNLLADLLLASIDPRIRLE